MKNLNQFIIERLKLTKGTKLQSKYIPTTYQELLNIIENKLKTSNNLEYLDLSDIEIYDIKTNIDGGNTKIYHELFKKIFDELNYSYDFCFKTINVSDWHIEDIESLHGLFKNAFDIEELIGIDDWNMSYIKELNFFFDGCYKLKNIGDLSKWKINNLVKAQGLFRDCESLTNIGDISKWNISNVTRLSNIFCRCIRLKDVGEIANWNLKSCLGYSRTFKETYVLNGIGDLTKWNKYIEPNTNAIANQYGIVSEGFDEFIINSSLEQLYDLDINDNKDIIKIIKKQ